MLEVALVRYCAPTLAGLKSGSLFNYSYLSLDYLLERIKHWNERCWEKGVRMTILSSGRGKSLVYVYRADKLKQDWASPNISEFLESIGYDPRDPEQSIALLSRRTKEKGAFPHEIGLFLSYPFEDVIGFIENKGKNCKYCGCWKVYSDETACKKLFQKYKKCTSVYCDCFLRGVSILKLTVAA